MKTIYIAGPMTGYPLWNFPAFDEAERHLRDLGWEVLNPAAISRQLGFDEHAGIEPTPEYMDKAMRSDIEAILSADAVFLLKDWQKSKGARAEQALAEWRGLRMISFWQHAIP